MFLFQCYAEVKLGNFQPFITTITDERAAKESGSEM